MKLDEIPWDQRVRESGFVQGRVAFREGRGRDSSYWHTDRLRGYEDRLSDIYGRAAFELGWDTEQRKSQEAENGRNDNGASQLENAATRASGIAA